MLKNALAGLALIIGTMGALANFLENGIADRLKASRVHGVLVGTKTPGVANNLSEVGLAFSGKHNVQERVVDAKLFLSDGGSMASCAFNTFAELSVTGIGLLLARKYTGVLVSTVASFKLINREAISAVGNLTPGTLDNCKASVAHISAHGLDEFVIGDAAILVVIKVVVQSAKLLSG